MSSTQLQLTPEQLNKATTAQWKAIIQQALVDLRVAGPAIVQSFDEDTQTVSVQIATSELVRFPNGPVWTAIAPINNVPICSLRAGSFSITPPIQVGDEGLLIFCDSCIDLWWQEGDQQPPPNAPLAQPNFERRRHDLNDCIFFPAIWNQKRVLFDYATDSIQIRSDDGTVYFGLATDGSMSAAYPGGADVDTGGGTFQFNEDVDVEGNLHVGSGASGTFSTGTGQTVTVQDGIIIDIS
jgi:hypothetical protein